MSEINQLTLKAMRRLAWKMPNGCTGHGRSFADGEAPWLERHVEDQNRRYGEGTHWVEKCGYCVAQWAPGPSAQTVNDDAQHNTK